MRSAGFPKGPPSGFRRGRKEQNHFSRRHARREKFLSRSEVWTKDRLWAVFGPHPSTVLCHRLSARRALRRGPLAQMFLGTFGRNSFLVSEELLSVGQFNLQRHDGLGDVDEVARITLPKISSFFSSASESRNVPRSTNIPFLTKSDATPL